MCMEITSKIVDSFLKQNAKNQKMKKLGEIQEIKCSPSCQGDHLLVVLVCVPCEKMKKW